MPPKNNKKKGPVEELITYDLLVMNRLELKEYAKILESDIEHLRNYSNFYQKSGDELADFYTSRVEELSKMEAAIVDKNREMEAIREKVAKDLLERSDFEAYDKFFNERRDEQKEREISDRLQKALEEHLEEEKRLKEIIDEKERELAAETTKLEMIRRDALEKTAKKMEDTEEKDRILFEKSMTAYANMLKETKKLHEMELESFKDETTEAKRKSEIQYQDRCRTYKERLQKYYKDTTREDLNTIKELTQKVKKLEDKIRDSQSKLKAIRHQNEELKRNQVSTKAPSKYVPQDKSTHRKIMKARRARNLKKIEEVKSENAKVHQQIHVVLEQSDNLRKDFSRALFEVRKNSEARTHRLKNRLETQANGDRNLEKARDAVRLLDKMPSEQDDEGEKVLTLEEMLALVRRDGDKILTLDQMQDRVGRENETLTLEEIKDLVRRVNEEEKSMLDKEMQDSAGLETEKTSTLDEKDFVTGDEEEKSVLDEEIQDSTGLETEKTSTLDEKDFVTTGDEQEKSVLDEGTQDSAGLETEKTSTLDEKDLVTTVDEQEKSGLDEEIQDSTGLETENMSMDKKDLVATGDEEEKSVIDEEIQDSPRPEAEKTSTMDEKDLVKRDDEEIQDSSELEMEVKTSTLDEMSDLTEQGAEEKTSSTMNEELDKNENLGDDDNSKID